MQSPINTFINIEKVVNDITIETKANVFMSNYYVNHYCKYFGQNISLDFVHNIKKVKRYILFNSRVITHINNEINHPMKKV